jgi:hypothetical protein
MKMKSNFFKSSSSFKFSTKNEDENANSKKGKNEEVLIEDMTMNYIYELRKEIESKVVDGSYSINFVPTPNCFGEVPIFMLPNENFSKRTGVEFSGVTLLTSITALNYLGLLFPPSLFYYFSFLSTAAAFKYFSGNGIGPTIVQMTLVDDKNIRVVYMDGSEEIAQIKNVIFNPNDRFNTVFNPEEGSNVKQNALDQASGPRKAERVVMIALHLEINGKKKIMIIRNTSIRTPQKMGNHISFVDLSLALAITSKKTKRINITI